MLRDISTDSTSVGEVERHTDSTSVRDAESVCLFTSEQTSVERLYICVPRSRGGLG